MNPWLNLIFVFVVALTLNCFLICCKLKWRRKAELREQAFVDIEYIGEEHCSIDEEPLPIYSPRGSYLPNIQAVLPGDSALPSTDTNTIAENVHITPLPPTYEESAVGQ